LQEVGKFPQIRVLNLNNSILSNDDFIALEKLECLESLAIDGISVNPAGFNLFKKFPNLKSLRARESSGIAELLAKLKNNLALTELDLSAVHRNWQDLNSLPEISNLERLVLNSFDFTGCYFEFLLRFPFLSEFSAADANFDDEAIFSLVEKSDKLEKLDISAKTADVAVSSEAMLAISNLQNLFSLSVAGRRIDDEFVRALSFSAKFLRELNLAWTLVSDRAIKFLRNFERLKKLNLAGCSAITDVGTELLIEGFFELREINIRGTSTTELSLALLSQRFPDARIVY